MSAYEHRDSTASHSSTSRSVKGVMKSAYEGFKQHNRDVQRAWEAYYGVYPASHPSSAATSRRPSEKSVASVSTTESSSSPSAVKKAWKAVKKHASEHHKSVSSAYAAYYGDVAALRAQHEALNMQTRPALV